MRQSALENGETVLCCCLEARLKTISRASGTLTFPANFILVAAMNPCPCGYHSDSKKSCTCSANVVARYQKHISGPPLDRVDIHVDVPRVNYEKLSGTRQGEPSCAIGARVVAEEVATLCIRAGLVGAQLTRLYPAP